jgi:hypothetical protein
MGQPARRPGAAGGAAAPPRWSSCPPEWCPEGRKRGPGGRRAPPPHTPRCDRAGQRYLLSVAAGQRVGHRVQAARPILHGEIKAEQLANPLMLGNCREALIK